MIHQLKSLIIVNALLAILWCSACQRFRDSHSPKPWSQLSGNILSRTPFGTNFRPLRILCYQASKVRVKPDRSLESLAGNPQSFPSEADLELIWNQNDVYFAYIRKPDFKNPLKLPQLIKRTELPLRDLLSMVESQNSVTFESPLSEGMLADFVFSYIIQWRDGFERESNGFLIDQYWASEQPGHQEKEELSCRFESPVTSQPPKINEKLTIEGPVYDTQLKRYIQVSADFIVDVIQETNGQLLLSSLSGNFSQKAIPIHAPVYNAQREIVGYVKRFKRNALLGVEVLSVHDKGLATRLKKITGLEHWTPVPTVKPGVSIRFQNLVCRCSAGLKSKQDADLRQVCPPSVSR